MKDETLIEPFSVLEYFVDGFAEHQIINGIFSCAGYRVQAPSRLNGDPSKVVVLKIVMPATSLMSCIELAQEAMRKPLLGLTMEPITKLVN